MRARSSRNERATALCNCGILLGHPRHKEGLRAVTAGSFLLVLLSAVCMALANLLMKNGITAAGGFAPSIAGLTGLARQLQFVCGFLLSGVAALMWFRILATQKLSTCYPLFVSLTYSLITLAAFYFLHERISLQKLVGLAAIVGGITAVARG
jgi:multidrug transporter EmrE-like cation transporter